MVRIVSTGVLACVAASALIPEGASAQTVSANDRIVITATRGLTDADDLPQSVDVLTREDVARIDQAEDVVCSLAGVQVAISNGSQATYQIRGVGAVDHQALTPGGAAVSVDGVVLATNVQGSALAYDLARVEVLKGPQGTIQGRNASSGSINFFTALPTSESEAYLDLSLGNLGLRDVRAAASGKLADGVSGRIAGRLLKQDAWLDNVGGPEDAGGKRDEYGVRASLVFEEVLGGRLILRAHGEADKGVNVAPLNSSLALDDHEISVGADGVQDSDTKFSGASAEYTTTLGGWAVTSLSAVETFRQRYGFDFDGMPAQLANLSYDRDYSQISQDLYGRKVWEGGEALVGVSLSTDDLEQDYLIWCGVLNEQTLTGTCAYPAAAARVGPRPASMTPAVSLLTHIEQTRRVGAVYGKVDLALGARTTLTLGGRQTFETISGNGFGQHIYRDGVRALNNRSGAGLAAGANAIDENRFTGMAALSHRFNEDAMAYVSFGQGYKSGGFNGEVANNVTHYQDEGLFRAETVDAWELGFKGGMGAALHVTAAAFYQDYQDPQARIFVAFPLPGGGSLTSNSLANLDAAIVKGVELTGDWQVTDSLRLTGGVVVLDTEISQDPDPARPGNAVFDGKPLPFASDLSATLGVAHGFVIGGRRGAFEINAKHQSDYFLDAEGRNDRRQKPLTLVDAEAWLDVSEGVRVSLWGRNLTDEDYALSGYGFVGYDTFRSVPATYGVSLRLER